MDTRAAKELLHIRGVLAPDGVEWAIAVANRNFIIHQYDEINRSMTWLTISQDLAAWRESLTALFARATRAMEVAPSSEHRT